MFRKERLRRERLLATFDDARRNSSILENACITMTTTLFALCKEDANDDDDALTRRETGFRFRFFFTESRIMDRERKIENWKEKARTTTRSKHVGVFVGVQVFEKSRIFWKKMVARRRSIFDVVVAFFNDDDDDDDTKKR